MNKIINKLNSIGKEILHGLIKLRGIGPTVTVFGSARTPRTNAYYKKAFNLGYKLASAGFNVLTGGGPGIMEAANKGAYLSQGAESIGFSIELDLEKKQNDFINLGHVFNFFFTRKYMMMRSAIAYVAFPGGVGTLDEIFEIITLVQCGKSKPVKIFFYGHDYYDPLIQYLRDVLLREGAITEADFDLFEVTDDLNYIIDEIHKHNERASA